MKTEIISVCMFLFLHVCRTLMDAAMLELLNIIYLLAIMMVSNHCIHFYSIYIIFGVIVLLFY